MAILRRASSTRKVELADAALHIIATKGIAALSTRSVAEQVGLSSGAMFRHFATVDALLDAVAVRVDSVLDATFPPADLPARDRLERFIEARSTAVGAQLGIMRLVVSEQFFLALPPDASSRLAACVRKSRAFVVACLREGQEVGDFRRDIDAEALSVIVVGTIRMLALSASPHSSRSPARTEGASVRAALFALLAPVSAAPRKPRRRPP